MLVFAWEEDGVVRFDIEDQVTELFLMTQQERVWSENDFTGQFFELWVASGGEVSVRQKEIETEGKMEEETEMGKMVNTEEEEEKEKEENENGEERTRDTELDQEKEKEKKNDDAEATTNSKGKEKGGERKRKGSLLENERGSRKKKKGTSVQQWAEPDMKQVSEQIQEDRRKRILEAPDMTLQELARLVCDPQSEEWLVWAKLKADYRDFFGQAPEEDLSLFAGYYDEKPRLAIARATAYLEVEEAALLDRLAEEQRGDLRRSLLGRKDLVLVESRRLLEDLERLTDEMVGGIEGDRFGVLRSAAGVNTRSGRPLLPKHSAWLGENLVALCKHFGVRNQGKDFHTRSKWNDVKWAWDLRRRIYKCYLGLELKKGRFKDEENIWVYTYRYEGSPCELWERAVMLHAKRKHANVRLAL